jgi:hypothetical protein
MNKDEIRQCLAREVELWSSKDYETLLRELAKAVSYGHGRGFVPVRPDRLIKSEE